MAMPATDYVALVVKPILTHPDIFRVSQRQDEMGVLLTIDVHKEDMGIIIGKNGETAKSIRHLVRIVGLVAKQRVSIRINEPEGSTYKRKEFSDE